jgi:methyltransferase (TIGR00027 family)
MDMQDQLINHISDTALWIAAYRAQETERPDAVFKDPLAKKLAGTRGYEMVAITPETEKMAFAMVTRTTALDRLVLSALRKGIDTVINLGAGLDTRPYRLNLPAQLQWIEVDFPHLIKYKNDMLANDKPVCQLERIASDLSKDKERNDLFHRLGKQTQKALIITEGVIGYLTNEQAAALSKDIYAIPTFQYWMMDYNQGKLRRNRYSKKLDKQLVKTPLRFSEKYPLQFFSQHGWHVEENIFILDEADRIGRKLPIDFPLTLLMKLFPKKLRDLGNKTYGYVMFSR